MPREEQPCVVLQALSSDCGSGWIHQDGDGDGGDGGEKRGLLRCRSCVLACRFVHLRGDDDGW